MYAIYYSDHQSGDSLRLYGVVKFESVARELAQMLSFDLRWTRHQIRYCRSPYLDGSIPPFAVYCLNRLRRPSYYGFFKIRDGAQRLADDMAAEYPGIVFNVRDISDVYELRASHMDSKSALF